MYALEIRSILNQPMETSNDVITSSLRWMMFTDESSCSLRADFFVSFNLYASDKIYCDAFVREKKNRRKMGTSEGLFYFSQLQLVSILLFFYWLTDLNSLLMKTVLKGFTDISICSQHFKNMTLRNKTVSLYPASISVWFIVIKPLSLFQ